MITYKYRLTITKDGEVKEQIVDSKEELCNILNITIPTLNNIIVGRSKKKYYFLNIERILMPPKCKKYEEEYKRAMNREANRKYRNKLKQQKKEEVINTILEKITVNNNN